MVPVDDNRHPSWIGTARLLGGPMMTGSPRHQFGASVDGIPLSPPALEILDRAKDALPDHNSYDIPGLAQFIGTLGCARCRMRAVVGDQELGRCPNVSDLDQAALPRV
jgi:hypothetical protein